MLRDLRLHDFRVLTVRQPWASAIVLGPKRVENRSWHIRPGWVAIHAGASMDRLDPESWEAIADLWPEMPPRAELPLGKVIGAAHFTGSVAYADRPWDWLDQREDWSVEDAVLNLIDCVFALPEPLARKGALGLWRADEEIVAAVREVLRAA